MTEDNGFFREEGLDFRSTRQGTQARHGRRPPFQPPPTPPNCPRTAAAPWRTWRRGTPAASRGRATRPMTPAASIIHGNILFKAYLSVSAASRAFSLRETRPLPSPSAGAPTWRSSASVLARTAAAPPCRRSSHSSERSSQIALEFIGTAVGQDASHPSGGGSRQRTCSAPSTTCWSGCGFRQLHRHHVSSWGRS